MTEPVKHWANIQERGSYWGMRLVLLIQRLLGRRLCFILMFPVTLLYFLMSRHARRASLDYLQKLSWFYPDLPLQATKMTSFRHFLAFTAAILDKLATWNNQIGLNDVVIAGRQAFMDVVERQQGAVILASHLGNIEVTRALASLNQRVKLNILMHTKNSQAFSRLVAELSGEHQIQLLEVTEITPSTAILLQQKIEQGEMICIVGDRVPIGDQGRIVYCDFLAHKAPFAQGPFILASLLACPVFTLFSVKENGRYHLYFEPFAESIKLKRGQREQSIQAYAQQFAKVLERFCEKAPLQWFNFYFYWQTHSTETGLEENERS